MATAESTFRARFRWRRSRIGDTSGPQGVAGVAQWVSEAGGERHRCCIVLRILYAQNGLRTVRTGTGKERKLQGAVRVWRAVEMELGGLSLLSCCRKELEGPQGKKKATHFSLPIALGNRKGPRGPGRGSPHSGLGWKEGLGGLQAPPAPRPPWGRVGGEGWEGPGGPASRCCGPASWCLVPYT